MKFEKGYFIAREVPYIEGDKRFFTQEVEFTGEWRIMFYPNGTYYVEAEVLWLSTDTHGKRTWVEDVLVKEKPKVINFSANGMITNEGGCV